MAKNRSEVTSVACAQAETLAAASNATVTGFTALW